MVALKKRMLDFMLLYGATQDDECTQLLVMPVTGRQHSRVAATSSIPQALMNLRDPL